MSKTVLYSDYLHDGMIIKVTFFTKCNPKNALNEQLILFKRYSN